MSLIAAMRQNKREMMSRRSLIWRMPLSATVAGAIVALILSPKFQGESMAGPFMSVAIASIMAIHLSVRFRDAGYVALTALTLTAVQHHFRGFVLTKADILSISGLSSALVLSLRTIWSKAGESAFFLCALIPALLFAFSDWTAATFLTLTEMAHPKTMDLYLYKFDCSLGFQPSFLVGQWFAHWRLLFGTSLVFYVLLSAFLAFIYGQQLRRIGRAALPIFGAFLIAGPVGIIFFNVVPAMGPIHVFSSFPAYPLALEKVRKFVLEPVLLPGPRNAIPSLHMTWILLAWWNSRGLPRWIRVLATMFVPFTILSTLGSGEHYLIDLVVACPFALMIHAAFLRNAPAHLRKCASFAAALTTLTWLALLSFDNKLFWINPFIPWTLVVATIVGVGWMVRKLASSAPITPSVRRLPSEIEIIMPEPELSIR